MSLTYNTLITQTQSEFSRSDDLFSNNIPDFIDRAQDRINLDLKNIELLQYHSSNFIVNNPVISLPNGWRRPITFNYGTGVNSVRNPIKLRKYEYVNLVYPDRTQAGSPKYYAIYDMEHYLIGPTPDAAYPFEIGYFGVPARISDSSQTNYLTNFSPTLLLNAVFVEAARWIKMYELIPIYEENYQKYLQPLIVQDAMRMVDRQADGRAD